MRDEKDWKRGGERASAVALRARTPTKFASPFRRTSLRRRAFCRCVRRLSLVMPRHRFAPGSFPAAKIDGRRGCRHFFNTLLFVSSNGFKRQLHMTPPQGSFRASICLKRSYPLGSGHDSAIETSGTVRAGALPPHPVHDIRRSRHGFIHSLQAIPEIRFLPHGSLKSNRVPTRLAGPVRAGGCHFPRTARANGQETTR